MFQEAAAAPAGSRVDGQVGLTIAIYTVLYLIYLWFCVDIESELTHWLTLVVLPGSGVWWLLRRGKHDRPFRSTLRRAGFNREHLGRGVAIGLGSGLALGLVQSGMSRGSEEIWALIRSGQVFVRLPVAFSLMLITAGFTEEFFFRGLLQGSLSRRWGRHAPAIAVASVAFGLYHLPYAYLLETWPTHGQFWPAVQEGVIFSAVMGGVLGGIYAWGRNLAAPVICHSLFNAVMLIPKLNFGIHFG